MPAELVINRDGLLLAQHDHHVDATAQTESLRRQRYVETTLTVAETVGPQASASFVAGALSCASTPASIL